MEVVGGLRACLSWQEKVTVINRSTVEGRAILYRIPAPPLK